MIDPNFLDKFPDHAARIAAGLEQAIITLTKKWATKPRRDRRGFMKALSKLVGVGVKKLREAIRKALAKAATTGQQEAQKDLKRLSAELKAKAPKAPDHDRRHVTVKTPTELMDEFRDIIPGLIGSGSQLYDEILKRMAARPPRNEADRLRVAQEALNDFKRRGITAFVDKGGRRWNIVSYVEMATRAAANQASAEAYLNEVAKAGHDVVRMTTAPNCSPQCLPFQGRLLTISGKTRGTYGGEPIVASLAEALAHGYRHPGCRHTLIAWFPGDPAPEIPEQGPNDYANSQKLRRLEREVRQAKRDLAAAATPEAKAAAHRDIRAAQARIRKHVAETGQKRAPEREHDRYAR